MSFKNRKTVKIDLIEEAYQEKLDNAWNGIKNFAKNNPGVTSVGGGAALGALVNHLNDGADSLEVARSYASNDVEADARNEFMDNKIIPENQFNSFINSARDGHDIKGGFWRDTVGDNLGKVVYGMDTDEEALEKARSFMKNTEGTYEMGPGANDIKVHGYAVDNNVSDDANYEAYKKYLAANPSAEHTAMVDKNVTQATDNHQKSIENSTRDSYLKSMGAGAALGGAGLFAKRKIDQNRQG